MTIARLEEIGTNRASHITVIGGVLDLDHLGTQIGEVLGAERPCPVLLDRNDANAFKR